jgi:hypothetical protein
MYKRFLMPPAYFLKKTEAREDWLSTLCQTLSV